MVHAQSFPVHVTLTVAFIIVGHVFSGVNCLPLMAAAQNGRDGPAMPQQLPHALKRNFMLHNKWISAAAAAAADPPRPSHPQALSHLPRRPHFFPRPPTDTPSLTDLLRSTLILQQQQQDPPFAENQGPISQPSSLPGYEGRELDSEGEYLGDAWEPQGKRSFDSISSNSGFGMQRPAWGGASRVSGDNLSFTFESLFPAIARRLRSIR